MQYRIEMSSTRKGVARIHLPGRELELEATQDAATAWQVAVSDSLLPHSGLVELQAANANDAIWRVARAAIRAVSELTGNPIEDGLRVEPDPIQMAQSLSRSSRF